MCLVLLFIALWSDYIVYTFLLLKFQIYFCGLKYVVLVNVP